MTTPKRHTLDLMCDDCMCEVKPERVILIADRPSSGVVIVEGECPECKKTAALNFRPKRAFRRCRALDNPVGRDMDLRAFEYEGKTH